MKAKPEPEGECTVCRLTKEALDRAEKAVEDSAKKIKRLDLMTYSQVAEWERDVDELKRKRTGARAGRTRHVNACGKAQSP